MTSKLDSMTCEIPYCTRKAKYAIRSIKENRWYNVCSVHDTYIGKMNLVSLGHSEKEAIEITLAVKSLRHISDDDDERNNSMPHRTKTSRARTQSWIAQCDEEAGKYVSH